MLEHGYVYLSLFVRKGGEAVQAALHVVHPDACVARSPRTPVVNALIHGMISWRLRPLLHTLDLLREVQRSLEGHRRRLTRLAGGGARPWLLRLVDPVVLHDACTLYTGCASMAVGAPDWSGVVLPEPCACGRNEWAVSCTPPRFDAAGRLTRDALDACVAWCWTCLARREVDTAPWQAGRGALDWWPLDAVGDASGAAVGDASGAAVTPDAGS